MALVALLYIEFEVFCMSYYLKKTRLKGRTYLSIDESFYSAEKKGTAHRCFKSLGSVETHIQNGIENPIEYFQKEVDKMNKERKNEKSKVKTIGEVPPITHLGYFLLKSIMDKLNVKKYIDYFKLTNTFNYDLFELLSALIYARCVKPCSKRKTYSDVIPNLYEKSEYSYNQLLSGLTFLGENYSKFIEIFNEQVKNVYGTNTEKTYFDCTNFYFEIDREDEFRRKGPSKENRHDPIVGLGLLLDKNQIPIGMKLYNGNESEKPVLREVINKLKEQNNIQGRTIHIADKGLNCAENIAYSLIEGDGYIFSKSVKQLPDIEKKWILLNNDYTEIIDKKSNKLIYKYKSCIDEFPYTLKDENGKTKIVKIKEKRLVVYSQKLAEKHLYEINKLADKALSLKLSHAKKEEYGECSKYVKFTDKEGKKAKVSINQAAIEKDKKLAGYNLFVTSEINMPDKEIYTAYHNLWRIEETFRIMKSNLDARPVFVQKRETIQGHFLICYLSVLLERLLQFNVLKSEYGTEEIFDFIRDFNVTKAETKYINTAKNSLIIQNLAKMFNLPLIDYFLSENDIKKIMNFKL
jgi:transposase